jgi:uncharacterized membrane protein YgcG
MNDSLGLSVGTTNLVAASPTGASTIRRAVVTLFSHRPPEVGVPYDNPRLDERGLVLTDFVERVGDPVPMVANDGSTHRGEFVLADALDALARSLVSSCPEATRVTVPAHWPRHVVDSLGDAVSRKPNLSSRGNPPQMVSDSVAALTALQAGPGLPARGIVALCDFGATGTSITLADAGMGFRSVGETVRYQDFSGELIDQAVMRNVLDELNVDPSGTSAVVSLSRVREQCRIAKERLSYDTATGFTGPLPGPHSTVRLTRAELEALLRDPLDGVINAVEETLRRNNIAPPDLAALATVGGGARIPYVTQRISDAMRIPVTTTPQSQVVAALGAALMALRGPDEEAATGLAMTSAALASTAASLGDTARHSAANSAVVENLAWSEDESSDDIPSAHYDFDDREVLAQARPEVRFEHDEYTVGEALPPLPWYRRPGVLFGAAASIALIAAVGLIVTWRTGGVTTTPVGTTATFTTSVAPPAPPAAPVTAVAPPLPVAPPPTTETVVVQRQVPNPPRRTQSVQAPPVAPPAEVAPPAVQPPVAPPPVAPPPVVMPPPIWTPPFTLPPLFPPDIFPPGGTTGTGSGGVTPGTGSGSGGVTPGTGSGGSGSNSGGSSGSNSSIPKCDDLPADTLC